MMHTSLTVSLSCIVSLAGKMPVVSVYSGDLVKTMGEIGTAPKVELIST